MNSSYGTVPKSNTVHNSLPEVKDAKALRPVIASNGSKRLTVGQADVTSASCNSEHSAFAEHEGPDTAHRMRKRHHPEEPTARGYLERTSSHDDLSVDVIPGAGIRQRAMSGDLAGKAIGELEVIERVWNYKNGETQYGCRCSCGADVVVRAAKLRGGHVKSCGDTVHRRAYVVSYRGAHRRVAVERGPARTHTCIDCGGTAAEWSYKGGDPLELADVSGPNQGLPYSLSIERYVARCRKCHRAHDRHTAKWRALIDTIRLSARGPDIVVDSGYEPFGREADENLRN